MSSAVNPDCSLPFIFEIIRLTLPSVVVVFGWFFVARLQRSSAAKQETRKDRRDAITRLNIDLRDLRNKCIEYYTDSMNGAILATQIKVITEDIRRQTDILANNLSIPADGDQIDECLIEIINAATGNEFETKNRKPLESSDPQLLSLFNHSAKLLMIFEDSFARIYPPPKNERDFKPG